MLAQPCCIWSSVLDPPGQNPPHPRGLAAGDGAALAGSGPLWRYGSIPASPPAPCRGFAENGIVPCPAAWVPVSTRQLQHGFEMWSRAHGAPVALVACPVVMLSTQGSSLCSQQMDVIIVVNYFSGPALVAQVSA